ncbi:acyl-CoA N-acyltransferase [Trichoderma longibrachiatum ATCC 18648]|uniref:histone acetyltransferase n=1 Tax=Trichoderma longibrachiatum ATCC 18648 TaxID=983965 RepID=A0A2T4C795_TRILO|nr:acyl-CoA N-acyltransferase [Trichoderma longibrachiatum ATCC 18648]
MPHKRKRPDEPDPPADAQQPDPQASTRRATRQTPVLPPPVPAAALVPPPPPPAAASAGAAPPVATTHKMAAAAAAAPAVTAVPLPPILVADPQKRGARNGPRPPAANTNAAAQPQNPSASPLQGLATAAPRSAIPSPLSPGSRVAAAAAAPAGQIPQKRAAPVAEIGSGASAKERRRPSDLVAPEITYHVPQANQQGRQSSLVRPHGPSAPPPRLDKIAPTPMVITPVLPPKPPTLPVSDRPAPRTDRNIDKVVLGNLCFRTWYPSYYGKEVLGLTSSHAKGASTQDGLLDAAGRGPSKKDKDGLPMLERLYVCPSCFKYAKELVAWWGHVKLCQQRAHIPGNKIYVHPKGRRTVYQKMSWDNNNLACILIFPPWQRKGLGALLMGASYEISRREGIMGGPEKPISDLGKKGYQRFWAGEIARWLLSLDVAPADTESDQETLVDVEDCSQATWIAPEDCLGVLRDMGVAEDAGIGPGKPEPLEEQQQQQQQQMHPSEEDKKKKQQAPTGEEDAAAKQNIKRASAEAEEDDGERPKPKPTAAKQVPRVRIDKEAVRRYVAAHRLVLDRTCDPSGFVEGYAMKKAEKAASEGAESRDEALGKGQ